MEANVLFPVPVEPIIKIAYLLLLLISAESINFSPYFIASLTYSMFILSSSILNYYILFLYFNFTKLIKAKYILRLLNSKKRNKNKNLYSFLILKKIKSHFYI